MESFVLDLSMSGDCGVTNSQGFEPFSYFGYLFVYYATGLSPMDIEMSNLWLRVNTAFYVTTC